MVPHAVPATRLEARRPVAQTCLPGGEHGLGIGVFDPAICHQHGAVGIDRHSELEGDHLVALQHADEPGVHRTGRRRLQVAFGDEGQHVFAVCIRGAGRGVALAVGDGPAGNRWAGRAHALVEHHGPVRRKIEYAQACGVEVRVLFHGLGKFQSIASLVRGELLRHPAGRLSKGRGGAYRPGASKKPSPPTPSTSATKPYVSPFQANTTGQLASWRCVSAISCRRSAARSISVCETPSDHCNATKSARGTPAEAHAQGHEALSRTGVRVEGVEHGPASSGPHLYAGAEPGSVGTHLVRFAASAEDKTKKGEAARSGIPPINAGVAGDDQGGSRGGIKRQGQGGCHPLNLPLPGDGTSAGIDDSDASGVDAQQVQQAVAIEVDYGKFHRPGGRFGTDERLLVPGSIAGTPGEQRPVRGDAVDFQSCHPRPCPRR